MYGFFISAGAYLTLSLIERHLNDQHQKEHLWKGALLALIYAILGARIYHVAHYWEFYSHSPQLIMAIWNGGLGIWGGLLGGLIGILGYILHHGLNVRWWLDIVAIFLPIGQAVGRLGNLFNAELYGVVSNLPLIRGRLPIFYLEAVMSLTSFGILYGLMRKYPTAKGSGVFVGTYLINFGLLRIVLENMRTGVWTISGMSVSNMFSYTAITVGASLVIRFLYDLHHLRPQGSEPQEAPSRKTAKKQPRSKRPGPKRRNK